jgi:uncharacterized protein (DUF2267 family)
MACAAMAFRRSGPCHLLVDAPAKKIGELPVDCKNKETIMQLRDSLMPYEQALRTAGEWMDELRQELGTPDIQSAYRAMRSVLHALRDQLIATESADLAAQLPMLIRGLYYEGYRPTEAPDRIRTCERFLQRIERELVPVVDPDPAEAARAVFTVIQNHVSAGEVCDVCRMLPMEIQSLWPAVHV